MNREIEFRMWNCVKDNSIASKYFYDVENVMECLKQQMLFNRGNKVLGYDHIGDGCAFEQYTGLTDRNGVKIWEGDLVSYHNPFSQKTYVHTVRWDERWAAFGMFEDGNDYCQESDWQKIVDVEVCGNIHESGGGEG